MSWFRRPVKPKSPKLDADLLRRIRSEFDRSSADEEHFPSSIDPRIYHVRLILDHLGDLNGRRVGDIGCGKGRFARVLAGHNPGAWIVGIDLSAAMLGWVKPPLAACMATMTALPLAGGSLDAVYATESLEHAVEIDAAVSEMCRVLKPGGRLVIIDKNVGHWGRFRTPDWEKWFRREELEELLRRHCRTVRSRYISYWEDVEPDGLFLAWMAEK
ncbi:MAG: methyltransferase domain-containing protein [Bryobacterales bacterium]|nr:methyltransferase domain-containing protein [Bryobacterales bacterium]